VRGEAPDGLAWELGARRPSGVAPVRPLAEAHHGPGVLAPGPFSP